MCGCLDDYGDSVQSPEQSALVTNAFRKPGHRSAGCSPSSFDGRRRTISRRGRPSRFAKLWKAFPER